MDYVAVHVQTRPFVPTGQQFAEKLGPIIPVLES
jgi:hypothetical protein